MPIADGAGRRTGCRAAAIQSTSFCRGSSSSPMRQLAGRRGRAAAMTLPVAGLRTVAVGPGRRWPAPAELSPLLRPMRAKKAWKLVVVVLAPLLVRMMMALGTVDPRAEEQLGRVVGLVRQVADRAIPDHRRVLIDRPLGGDDVAHELVVRHVRGEGVADPGVEGVGAALVLLRPLRWLRSRSPHFTAQKSAYSLRARMLVDRTWRACPGRCRPGTRAPRRASAACRWRRDRPAAGTWHRRPAGWAPGCSCCHLACTSSSM